MKGSANHLVGLYQFSSLSVNYSFFFFLGFKLGLCGWWGCRFG